MTTKKEKSADETEQPVRIVDVAKPGTLPPTDATTRPVIVTNRVVMRDPMMAPESTAEPAAPRSTKVVIQPVDQIEEPAPPAHNLDADSDGMVDHPAESTAAAEPKPEPKPEPVGQPAKPSPALSVETQSGAAPDPPVSPSRSSSPDEIPSSLDPEKTMRDQEAAALEADAKLQDEIDTLVDEKTYFLPINSIEKRRSRHVYILSTLLIILLALAWADVALDAGLIHVSGVHPITHLFSTP